MHRNLRLYRHSSCSTDYSFVASVSQENLRLPVVKAQEKPSLIGALKYGKLQLRVLKRCVEERPIKKEQYFFQEKRHLNYKKPLPKLSEIKNRSVALQTTGFSPWYGD